MFASSLENLQPIARYLPEKKAFEPVLPEHDLTQAEAVKLNSDLLTQFIHLNATYPIYQNGLQLGEFETKQLEPPECGDTPQILGQWKPTSVKTETKQKAIGYAPALSDLPSLSLPKP